jgi:hypothetical protein
MKIVKEALAVYLTQEFTVAQADFLAQVISDSYLDLVKTSDFTELKAIVERLAIAQERSERRLDTLTDAQLRTEKRMDQIDKHMEQVDKRLDLNESFRW